MRAPSSPPRRWPVRPRRPPSSPRASRPRRPPNQRRVPFSRAVHPAMELGSCSRRSWADEVEAEERELASPFQLPPLVAAAHASLILRSSSLDPGAEPFVGSPGGSGERVHFTDSEASSYDSDVPPSSRRGPAVRPPRQQRRRRRRRNRRRAPQLERQPMRTPSPPPRRMASVDRRGAPRTPLGRA